jgi:hypothetical protein
MNHPRFIACRIHSLQSFDGVASEGNGDNCNKLWVYEPNRSGLGTPTEIRTIDNTFDQCI